MKSIDMTAFVGKDFDCEFTLGEEFSPSQAHIGLLSYAVSKICYQPSNHFLDYSYCRPRLNKPQVLDDWSWVADGLVWQGRTEDCGRGLILMPINSSKLRSIPVLTIHWMKCVGVEPDYAEWGKEHGMEVVEL